MFQKIFRKRNSLGAGAAVLALAGLLALGGAAYAQQAPAPQPARRIDRVVDHMKTVLDLSDAQASQIRGILQQQMQAAQPLVDQQRQARLALRQAVVSGHTDTATLQPLANQIGQTASELALLRAQAAGQILPILTPDQQAKAKKLFQARGRFARHRGIIRQQSVAPSQP